MLFDLQPHVRPAARLGIPTLAVCVALLAPVSASGKTHHEPTPSPDPAAVATTESSVDTPSEERRTRREERQAARALDGEAGCTIELQPLAPLTAGDPASLLGSLSCPAADAAGQTVSIYQKVPHTSGFVLAGTTTTEADGAFQFAPSELSTDNVFYATADYAKSDRAHVRITPVVALTAPAISTQLFTGATSGVTFTGTVSPSGPDAVVALQREDGGDGRWHQIALGRVGAEGEYSITHIFHRAGKANIRVVVHFRGLNTSAASNPITYQISRRQHKRLTIEASADTILYGQSLTISGAVAGAADEPVTLLAQTSTGGFEQVATATTGESGEYSFTETPVQNTRYRALSGAVGSVVLHESVVYALTAEPSASTVQAGEQLTVSGSVNPAHAGQTVRLELQNPFGVGFHVVASGTVGSGSSYSITFAPAEAGAEVMRVTVPGGQLNGSAASTPFSVQVTPAAG